MTQKSRRSPRCVIAFLTLLFLCGASAAAAGGRILWIVGGPSHGYGEHEYRAGAELLAGALQAAAPGFEVVVQRGWPAPGVLAEAAAVVLSMDGRGAHLALPHLEELERETDRGLGVLALHWAVHVPRGDAGNAFSRWIGGYYETDYSTNPKWRARLAFAPDHPISHGLAGSREAEDELEIFDEWYFNIRFPELPGVPSVLPIATAVPSDQDRSRVSAFWPWASPPDGIVEASGQRETVVWALERADGGRGVGFTGGHFHWNLANDGFRRLLLNAILWVAGGEVPEGGVASPTPGMSELRANQDGRAPLGFDEAELAERFGIKTALEREGPSSSHVPLNGFSLPEDLQIELWAESPQLYNPSNIDIDAAGRVWVAESWNYRGWPGEREQGDRIVVLEDTDGDGRADSSHVFVQEPALKAPLGIAVIGNRVLVSMAPHLILYTDVDGDRRFDPAVDSRTHLLSGFGGPESDHALHSVVVGPDGFWYGNFGNDGGDFRDGDGRRFHFKGRLSDPTVPAEMSDDGRRYVGGAAFRMAPDATHFEVIGHNFRNAYELAVTSRGDVFQNDNDDGDASRTSYLPEYGNAGYRSSDGTRTWFLDRRPGQSVASAHWRQLDPGVMPAGDVYGSGAPTGIVVNEGDGLGDRYKGLLISADSALETVLAYRPEPHGAGFELERFDLLTANPTRRLSGTDTSRGAPMTGIAGYFGDKAQESRALGYGPAWFERVFRTLGLDRAYTAPRDAGPLRFRPSDVAIGTDGALYVADWLDAFVGGNTMSDMERRGAIYRISRKGTNPTAPKHDGSTILGAVELLRSPAVNVRALGFEALRERGAEAYPAVAKLLQDPDEWVRARAVWLLPYLGPEGIAAMEGAIANRLGPDLPLSAFRAARRIGHPLRDWARLLASDAEQPAALRRQAFLELSTLPLSDSDRRRVVTQPDISEGMAADPWLLEAYARAAAGLEDEIYGALAEHDGSAHPYDWERVLWRLRPQAAIAGLRVRALSAEAAPASRLLAIDALAFSDGPEAADALREVAATGAPGGNSVAGNDEFSRQAAWWLERNAAAGLWEDYDTSHPLLRQYSPDLVVDFRALADAGVARQALPGLSEILALAASPDRGRELFRSGRAPCSACHVSQGVGGSIGPDLSAVRERLDRAAIVTRMLQPTSELMPPASGLGLSAQDVADLAAYLSEPRR